MEDLIKINQEVYDFPPNLELPEECKEAIFIPAFSVDCKHYYFLIDYKERKIKCWNIDLIEIKNSLKSRLDLNKIEAVPWNQGLDRFLEAIYFAHSADYHNGYIYVSFIDGNFILALNIRDETCKLIYDKADNGLNKLFSSTNVIHNDEIYFSRWRIEDAFKHVKDQAPVNVEVGKYSIREDRFEIIDTYEGPDDIHYTVVTPDGDHLLMVEMTQDPRVKYLKDRLTTPVEKMIEILKGGLLDSQLKIYNLKDKTSKTIYISDGPAHIEFDPDDKSVFYSSSHNLSTNNDVLCCFGRSRIDKMKLSNIDVSVIGSYTDQDFFRTPSHKIFKLDGKKLMIVPVFPNRIHVIDATEMTTYKKINLSKKAGSEIDFSQGPFQYPPVSSDKTPYTIHPINNSSYLYLCSVWNITVYDFMEERKLSSIMFNINKPLVAMGHASKFDLSC